MAICITSYQYHLVYIILFSGVHFILWINFAFNIIIWLFCHYVNIDFFFFLWPSKFPLFAGKGMHRTPSEEEMEIAVLHSAGANLGLFSPVILWATHALNWKTLLIFIYLFLRTMHYTYKVLILFFHGKFHESHPKIYSEVEITIRKMYFILSLCQTTRAISPQQFSLLNLNSSKVSNY